MAWEQRLPRQPERRRRGASRRAAAASSSGKGAGLEPVRVRGTLHLCVGNTGIGVEHEDDGRSGRAPAARAAPRSSTSRFEGIRVARRQRAPRHRSRRPLRARPADGPEPDAPRRPLRVDARDRAPVRARARRRRARREAHRRGRRRLRRRARAVADRRATRSLLAWKDDGFEGFATHVAPEMRSHEPDGLETESGAMTGSAAAIAHPNIALSKYWGKRAGGGNFPAVPSLSVTLAGLATRTRVTLRRRARRRPARPRRQARRAGRRGSRRRAPRSRAPRRGRTRAARDVESANDFPTASGLASSASGFAALALAAARAAGLDWDAARVSDLARRSSASAARSLFGGFVELAAGPESPADDASLAARPVAPAGHLPARRPRLRHDRGRQGRRLDRRHADDDGREPVRARLARRGAAPPRAPARRAPRARLRGRGGARRGERPRDARERHRRGRRLLDRRDARRPRRGARAARRGRPGVRDHRRRAAREGPRAPRRRRVDPRCAAGFARRPARHRGAPGRRARRCRRGARGRREGPSRPGKLVLTGAYAVLEGAPAIVVAVDRYAVADTSRAAASPPAEVRAAFGADRAPEVDVSALQDAGAKARPRLERRGARGVARRARARPRRGPRVRRASRGRSSKRRARPTPRVAERRQRRRRRRQHLRRARFATRSATGRRRPIRAMERARAGLVVAAFWSGDERAHERPPRARRRARSRRPAELRAVARRDARASVAAADAVEAGDVAALRRARLRAYGERSARARATPPTRPSCPPAFARARGASPSARTPRFFPRAPAAATSPCGSAASGPPRAFVARAATLGMQALFALRRRRGPAPCRARPRPSPSSSSEDSTMARTSRFPASTRSPSHERRALVSEATGARPARHRARARGRRARRRDRRQVRRERPRARTRCPTASRSTCASTGTTTSCRWSSRSRASSPPRRTPRRWSARAAASPPRSTRRS